MFFREVYSLFSLLNLAAGAGAGLSMPFCLWQKFCVSRCIETKSEMQIYKMDLRKKLRDSAVSRPPSTNNDIGRV